jgi:hypothetical protein
VMMDPSDGTDWSDSYAILSSFAFTSYFLFCWSCALLVVIKLNYCHVCDGSSFMVITYNFKFFCPFIFMSMNKNSVSGIIHQLTWDKKKYSTTLVLILHQ